MELSQKRILRRILIPSLLFLVELAKEYNVIGQDIRNRKGYSYPRKKGKPLMPLVQQKCYNVTLMSNRAVCEVSSRGGARRESAGDDE